MSRESILPVEGRVGAEHVTQEVMESDVCMTAAAQPDPLAELSEQERNLAALILSGHSETSAAKQMNITLNTQKGYRKNIYIKLNIHSKRELFELVNHSV